jgi:hypothetical protein
MKLFLTLIAALSGLYLAGDMIRQNQKLDALLSTAENFYSVLNRKLLTANIVSGLRVLQRLYGFLAVVLLIIFVLGSLYGWQNSAWKAMVATSLIFALIAWFSILWCLDHKRVVSAALPNAALFVVGPLAIGLMDLLLGSNFTSIFASQISQLLQTLHVSGQLPSNPVATGAITAAMFAVFWLLQYMLAWFLCFPFSLMALIIAATILSLAKAIDTFAPKKPFVGLVAFLFLASTLALVYI